MFDSQSLPAEWHGDPRLQHFEQLPAQAGSAIGPKRPILHILIGGGSCFVDAKGTDRNRFQIRRQPRRFVM